MGSLSKGLRTSHGIMCDRKLDSCTHTTSDCSSSSLRHRKVDQVVKIDLRHSHEVKDIELSAGLMKQQKSGQLADPDLLRQRVLSLMPGWRRNAALSTARGGRPNVQGSSEATRW